MNRYFKLALLCAGTVLVLWLLLWMVIANPLNLFVRKSAHFSQENFRAVRPGTPISSAISLLGDPVKIVPASPDADCLGCAIYYFMGDPSPWLIGFDEAWLIVDADGNVVQSVEHSEP